MLKIGITGQAGFIGTHIFNSLTLQSDKFSTVPFKDEYFDSITLLETFVSKCDVIIHLAAMNRHEDPKVLYKTNVKLVQNLISALKSTNSTPHVIFSSSVQEDRDNLYGASKKEGRRLFADWAKRTNSKFTGLLIPNVFGPFGAPFYNSAVATFCHQLTHDETPEIHIDGTLKLIYVGELVEEVLRIIETKDVRESSTDLVTKCVVKPTAEKKVSEILEQLENIKDNYFSQGLMPNLNAPFERNLFNTFVCYIEHSDFYPFILTEYADNRGAFVEVIRLSSGGQVSFSTTKPGITRGNHFHTRKAERFTVIKGQAKIELRRIGTDKKQAFLLDGQSPSFVDMPIWHTHNITNIGDEDLYTIFWINEHFNPDDQDTYFEEV